MSAALRARLGAYAKALADYDAWSRQELLPPEVGAAFDDAIADLGRLGPESLASLDAIAAEGGVLGSLASRHAATIRRTAEARAFEAHRASDAVAAYLEVLARGDASLSRLAREPEPVLLEVFERGLAHLERCEPAWASVNGDGEAVFRATELARRAPTRAALLARLVNSSSWVGLAAITWLLASSSPDDAALGLAHARALSVERRRALASRIHRLEAIGEPSRRRAAWCLVEDPDPQVRGTAIGALAATHEPVDLERYATLLAREPAARVRSGIVSALASLGHGEPRARVIEVLCAHHEPDPVVEDHLVRQLSLLHRAPFVADARARKDAQRAHLAARLASLRAADDRVGLAWLAGALSELAQSLVPEDVPRLLAALEHPLASRLVRLLAWELRSPLLREELLARLTEGRLAEPGPLTLRQSETLAWGDPALACTFLASEPRVLVRRRVFEVLALGAPSGARDALSQLAVREADPSARAAAAEALAAIDRRAPQR